MWVSRCSSNLTGGLVNLTLTAHTSSAKGPGWDGFSRDRRFPVGECACAEQPVVTGSQQVAPDPKEILHDVVDRREALQLTGRLEAPHLALPAGESVDARLRRDCSHIER